LGIYGHSLGAAVAIVGAVQHAEIEAVAAESPFSNLSRTVGHFARRYYGLPYMPFIPLALLMTSLRLGVRKRDFAPAEAIGKISPRPVFLIFAERDGRTPLKDADDLWKAAREPKESWIVPGADHGEPWVIAKDEYESRLVGFFERTFR
ncbi:MAG TPA: alpha/beta hydrolase, partial [Elusimicrobiota bacterium]|nr:alpha/beta hydrolase [Elusimicrobiota bacterium]